MQNELRQAVEDLREATTAVTTPALRRNLISMLEKCAKYVASSATQCVVASSGVDVHNRNTIAQTELNIGCRLMVQHIPSLVSGVKGTLSHPDHPTMQLNLINASEQFLQPASAVVKAAKTVLPAITDKASAIQLNNSSQQLSIALTDLRSVVSRAKEVCMGLEFDAAEELVISLKNELQEVCKAVEASALKPLPGETLESTSLKLGSVSKSVEIAMTQLLSATKQGNEKYTGAAAREVSTALKDLLSAVRGVAATIIQQDSQWTILIFAEEVITKSIKLIKGARWVVRNSNESDINGDLAATSREVSQALNNCISCLPGQKEVHEALCSIEELSESLGYDEFPATKNSYGYVENDLISHKINASYHMVNVDIDGLFTFGYKNIAFIRELLTNLPL